jgi:signal transduction histidine kinase
MLQAERKTERIDWSQLWYPGPTRVFSAAELAAAGGAQPSRTFMVMLAINMAILAQGVLQLAPESQTARMSGLLVAFAVLGWQGGLALWREPTRKRLFWLSIGGLLVFVLLALGIKWRVPDDEERRVLLVAGGIPVIGLLAGFWFVAVFRAQQIAGRLREIEEQARARVLQAQLTQAQIQPHFLFNSLASLQHWVETHDERAAPLLRSLTGYLRATLPLFNRERLSLGEELAAVREYLDVMQARLGSRLRFSIEAPEPLLATPLPPAILLTLVENAIEHGVGPKLGPAQLNLRVERQGAHLLITVVDDGPGLPDAPAPIPSPGSGRGVGLANSRLRLAQMFGERACLTLENAEAGGCIARLSLPMDDETNRNPEEKPA